MQVALAALATVVFLAPPTGVATAAAKAVEKTVKTTIAISATRAPDGTITTEVAYSSPNPRCLAADRFPTWRDGHFNTVGSILYYRGSQDYSASPPNGGWLTPVSRAGVSPYVWKSVWSGATPSRYVYKGNVSEPFTATIAEATSLYVVAWAGSKRFVNTSFKVKYMQGQTKIKLTCAPAEKQLRLVF